MALDFLSFEKPIAELEAKIEELRLMSRQGDMSFQDEIRRLERKSSELTKHIFSNLTAMQIVQLARHSQRPYTLDYIEKMFTDFDELCGDRHFADDHSIVGGLARFEGQPVMVIGHQKGRKTKESLYRNFGMSKPEGYRRALRLMEMAERFKLPIFTFIDTPGAYPGIGAEERNQSEAIARNLFVMSQLKVPVIATVIGEGGSGGALALGVADRVLMLQYSVYSVISPEGCSLILWRDTQKIAEAAEAMGVTADKIKALNLIDDVIPEPLGGAHRDHDKMAEKLKSVLVKQLDELKSLSVKEMVEQRYNRLMSMGLS